MRQAAGVLPMAEAIEGITDREFAIDGRLPLYSRDGAERLQTFLRESCGLVETVVGPFDVKVRSSHAVKATAEQWAVVQDIQRLVPDANVVLREHVLSSKQHESVSLTVFGVLVTKKHGPSLLRAAACTWWSTLKERRLHFVLRVTRGRRFFVKGAE